MNEVDLTFLNAVYEDLVRQGKRPSAKQLFETTVCYWAERRDFVIDEWSKRTLEQVPASRLHHLLKPVDGLLYDLCDAGSWGYPEDEYVPAWVAHGLACLRWYYREMSGREPALNLDVTIVANWLEKREAMPVSRNTNQPSLFAMI